MGLNVTLKIISLIYRDMHARGVVSVCTYAGFTVIATNKPFQLTASLHIITISTCFVL